MPTLTRASGCCRVRPSWNRELIGKGQMRSLTSCSLSFFVPAPLGLCVTAEGGWLLVAADERQRADKNIQREKKTKQLKKINNRQQQQQH